MKTITDVEQDILFAEDRAKYFDAKLPGTKNGDYQALKRELRTLRNAKSLLQSNVSEEQITVNKEAVLKKIASFKAVVIGIRKNYRGKELVDEMISDAKATFQPTTLNEQLALCQYLLLTA